MKYFSLASIASLSALVLLNPAPAASAADTALLRLLAVLRDRGSISAEEYNDLKAAAEADAKPAAVAAPSPVPAAPGAPTSPATGGVATTAPATGPAAPATAAPSTTTPAPKPPKWYDKLNIRGYAQFRYNAILDNDGPGLNVPNDRSVSTSETFLIRRARLILSGDVSDHVYLYFQPDFNASPSDGQYSAQLRDVYADISFDSAKEYRVRVGQSKVPFGFVNMQSSQNRAPLERPDALNYAVEGERDIGAFFYWAPSEARKRYAELVSSGLKGSGDYGVAGLGIYSGQGLNRSDRNGDVHVVGRLEYPFEILRDQILELGIQAYTGKFVVDTEAVQDPLNPAATVRPTADADGITDQRVGLTAVWYPKPFGFEAEWNVGRGPTLSSDFRSIESEFLHGGYVQLNYRQQTRAGVFFPYTRWQYYDGGRKFGRNAPDTDINELEFGIEWSPWKELEFAISYTHTFHRTNTRVAPYTDAAGSDRIGLQVQWNY